MLLQLLIWHRNTFICISIRCGVLWCIGWGNPSSSPPLEFGFGDKCCCNLSDYNHATFSLRCPNVVWGEICRKLGFYISSNFNNTFLRPCSSSKIRVQLIRMALYGTPAKTLGQGDVIIE